MTVDDIARSDSVNDPLQHQGGQQDLDQDVYLV